ncbi:hypothetical protein TBR22_A23490 [Luteitalea sp. TBR-22]|uniref:hypothetical protein n=1 Tax=Luteitalea sp. TBR-22 TaxID=2802971 RepID=UPI001AF21617|nr:hypothetical protein [Luteitalea sp. TBR-22]BCS33122.1 hypothetical protein TBR22_A23490 [Luteitalea sp. TBR-22]
MIRTFMRAVVLAAALPVVLLAGTKFTSTWAAPEARGVQLTGKKVVVLVMSPDDSLRMSGEEGMVDQLKPRGIEAVAAYRTIPKEVLKDTEQARGWFERAGVEGVVVLRLVGNDRRTTYVPPSWTEGYYTSLWGYYGYGWGAMYDPGYTRQDHVVSIESLVFSVPMNKLLWAGSSESSNPKDSRKLLADLVKEAAKEMKKQGLAVR